MTPFTIYGLVALALFAFGGWTGQHWTAKHYEHLALVAEHDAKAKTDSLGETATLLRKARDAEKDRISARLADALVGLRNRPERLPPAAAAACVGASGRELSRPDAEFLERLAFEADRLRAVVREQQAWIDQVTK